MDSRGPMLGYPASNTVLKASRLYGCLSNFLVSVIVVCGRYHSVSAVTCKLSCMVRVSTWWRASVSAAARAESRVPSEGCVQSQVIPVKISYDIFSSKVSAVI